MTYQSGDFIWVNGKLYTVREPIEAYLVSSACDLCREVFKAVWIESGTAKPPNLSRKCPKCRGKK